MSFAPPAGTETIADLNAYLVARYSLPPFSSLDHPTPSSGPASSKAVPPHSLSPPAAPPAKRQWSGAPEAPPVAPLSGSQEPSIFDVLIIFRRRWFLNRDHLIANILSATKDDAGRLDWIDFLPPFVKAAAGLG